MNQDNNPSNLVQLDTTAFRKSVGTHERECDQMYILYKTLF